MTAEENTLAFHWPDSDLAGWKVHQIAIDQHPPPQPVEHHSVGHGRFTITLVGGESDVCHTAYRCHCQ